MRSHSLSLSRTAILLFASTLISACAYPPIFRNAGIEESEDTVLAPGESNSVRFFTNYSNFDTGIYLQEGNSYMLDIVVLSNWVDGDIAENENGEELDERGFSNELMALEFFGNARRSRQHQWFELMLVQPRCAGDSLRGVSDLSFDPTTSSYEFVAVCDGELTLFVNDTYGFYSNNTGFAGIALSRN